MATTPLIFDLGASCCIMLHSDNFTMYSKSKVKIKELSGINKVDVEGLIKWKVFDKLGGQCIITLEGIHVPSASICLIGPQCIF